MFLETSSLSGRSDPILFAFRTLQQEFLQRLTLVLKLSDNLKKIFNSLIEGVHRSLQTCFVWLNSSLFTRGATVLRNFREVSANVGTGNLVERGKGGQCRACISEAYKVYLGKPFDCSERVDDMWKLRCTMLVVDARDKRTEEKDVADRPGQRLKDTCEW